MVTVQHRETHPSVIHRFTHPKRLTSVALRYAVLYEYTDLLMRHRDYATLLSRTTHPVLMVDAANNAYDAVVKDAYNYECHESHMPIDGNGYDTVIIDAGVAW